MWSAHSRRGSVHCGYLTDDPTSPLYRFNLLPFHKDHLTSWADYQLFRTLVEEMQTSNGWESWHPRIPGTRFNSAPERKVERNDDARAHVNAGIGQTLEGNGGDAKDGPLRGFKAR